MDTTIAQASGPSGSRVSLVTGGSGGLGTAVCRSLGRDGHVIVVDVDGAQAKLVRDELRVEGMSVSHHACDVGDPVAVAALREAVIAKHGKLDVLVNMAGVNRSSLLVKIDDADFSRIMSSHLIGTLNTMRAFAPDMRSRDFGRIVNTSSVAALGSVGGGSYGAAKGAIEALSRSAALEFARYGITVNCIAPGIIDTGMFSALPDAERARFLERTPMGRPGQAGEVAACVNFFTSSEASFVTGQTLFVCGGLSVGALD